MSDAIKPALTPAEWAREQMEAGNAVDISCGLVWACLSSNPKDRSGEVEGDPPPWLVLDWHSVSPEMTVFRRHALAALALHRQPFGFTREDLTVIDDAIDEAWDAAAENHTPAQAAKTNRIVAGLAALRDRIEALLPP